MVTMDKSLQVITGLLLIATTVVGTTLAIDSRYAKSQEVKAQLQEYYDKQLKLKILELDLKQNPSPEDRALRQYLMQELQKTK